MTAPHPDHYAVVIGIDDYAGLKPLSAARHDASTFAEWLKKPDGGGLDERNIQLVLSPTPNDDDQFSRTPILQHIQQALSKLGATRPHRVGARLYFYFAGHGFGPMYNDVAMLLASAANNRLTNLGLSRTIQYFHDAAVFDEVVFILDCCREDIAFQCNGLDYWITPDPHRPPTNDFALLGCIYRGKAHEPFDESQGRRRGLLTQAVLDGLQGAAGALDGEGRITDRSLAVFVEARLKDLAQQAGVEQQPHPPQFAVKPIVFRQPTGARFRLTLRRGAVSRAYPVAGYAAGVEVFRHAPGDDDIVEDLPLGRSHSIMVEGGGVSLFIRPDMVVDGGLVHDLP